VDLVVDQVEQLQDVDVADRDRARERLAAAAVEQLALPLSPISGTPSRLGSVEARAGR
jgi:hypothetical protein